MKKQRTISFSLSSVFISLLILSFLILVGFNFYKSSQNSFELLNKVTESITNRTIDKVQYYLNKTNTHIKALSSIYNNNSLETKQLTVNIMQEYIKSEKHISSIFIGDHNGNFIQVRRYPNFAVREILNKDGKREDTWNYTNNNFNTVKTVSTKAKYDPRTRSWYKNAKKDEIGISEPYIFASTKELGITVYYAKFDDKGKKLFVTAIDITLDSLNSFLKSEAKVINGSIVLISSNKKLIATTNKLPTNQKELPYLSNIKSDKPVIQAANKFIDGHSKGIIEFNGINSVYSGKTFKINDTLSWDLVISVLEDNILGNVKKTLYETIGISIIILIIFIIIAISISKRISKPIVKLSNDIDQLQHLNLDININNNSNIEEIRLAQDSLISLKSGLNSFSKYMPADLVKILIETGQEAKIGGVEKDLAVMFTDIEGFTTISETLTPVQLTTQLSEYFDLMANIITNNEGTIDKYIGDAVMAFWGAPLDIDNPVHKAIGTALELQKDLAILNTKWQKEGKAVLNTRIGIHYGKTLVGNIGSEKRMNYTIIGDSVNIASRLEGINKNYGTNIMVSQEVYEIIKDQYDLKYVDDIELKGKTKKSKIYSI
ncbi:MAG: adenylate/guanylate cyclase domain-containing protein [Campylobacterota bacterium]|nr:adenylate/guanylate cyclase domain-containing protein [Campylobacterota bacterium]